MVGQPCVHGSPSGHILRLSLEYCLTAIGCYRVDETIVMELPPGDTLEAKLNAITPRGPKALSEIPHTRDLGIDTLLYWAP